MNKYQYLRFYYHHMSWYDQRSWSTMNGSISFNTPNRCSIIRLKVNQYSFCGDQQCPYF